MRSTLKDLEYYNLFITRDRGRIEKLLSWIEIGKVKEDRVLSVKGEIFRTYLHLAIIKYTMGLTSNEMKNDFLSSIKFFEESWSDNAETPEDKYHFDNYILMLWMISLGILLEITDDNFKRLIAVLDRSKRKDYIFEYLISYRISGRVIPEKVTYVKPFSNLQSIIGELDINKASNMMKNYLDEWYKNMKLAYWYDNHKSKHDTFFGYWSFESAAVVKIKGLNDNFFSDNQYYPKDLINK